MTRDFNAKTSVLELCAVTSSHDGGVAVEESKKEIRRALLVGKGLRPLNVKDGSLWILMGFIYKCRYYISLTEEPRAFRRTQRMTRPLPSFVESHKTSLQTGNKCVLKLVNSVVRKLSTYNASKFYSMSRFLNLPKQI